MKTPAISLPLYEVDPTIAAAIDNETRRQHEGLELIASENFVSEAVLEAMGSVFTNKYAEGYPGKRYYGGCEFADVVENLARDRAKQLVVEWQPFHDRLNDWRHDIQREHLPSEEVLEAVNDEDDG